MRKDTILALEPGGLQADAWTVAVDSACRAANGGSHAERRTEA